MCPDSRSATVREASSPTRPATLARPDRGTAAGAMNGKERNEGAFLSIFEGTTVPTTESPYETSDQSRRPSLRKLLYCDKSHSLFLVVHLGLLVDRTTDVRPRSTAPKLEPRAIVRGELDLSRAGHLKSEYAQLPRTVMFSFR